MMNKFCGKCKCNKPLNDFYNDKRSKDGKQHHCKICHSNYYNIPENKELRKKYLKEYYKNNHDMPEYKEKKNTYRKKYAMKPEKKIADYKTYLLRTYGITLEQYNQMLEEQEGKCKICGKHHSESKKRMAVDHNHETGAIRGLLCTNCNTGIGLFLDNPTLIENAINYLKEYK